MVEVVCPCGKRLRTKEKNAGRTANCPACGAAVHIPLPPAVEPEPPPEPGPIVEAPFAGFAPGFAPIPPPPATKPESRSPPAAIQPRWSPPPPPDPWYHVVLVWWAMGSVFLAAGQFVLVAVFCALMFADSDRFGAQMLFLPPLFGASLGFLLLMMVFVSPVMVLLDIARNVRAMRHAREWEGQG